VEISYTNGGDKQIQRHKRRYVSVPDVLTVFLFLIAFFLVFPLFQGFMHIGYVLVVRLGLTSGHLMNKAERGDKGQEGETCQRSRLLAGFLWSVNDANLG
jgi:hypothetical protein